MIGPVKAGTRGSQMDHPAEYRGLGGTQAWSPGGRVRCDGTENRGASRRQNRLVPIRVNVLIPFYK